MDLLSKIKDHILVTMLIIAAGVFSIMIAVIKDYFGLAVAAFLGLAACSSVLLFILPIALMKGDKE
jgi:predicted RND superfamily exporter protein